MIEYKTILYKAIGYGLKIDQWGKITVDHIEDDLERSKVNYFIKQLQGQAVLLPSSYISLYYLKSMIRAYNILEEVYDDVKILICNDKMVSIQAYTGGGEYSSIILKNTENNIDGIQVKKYGSSKAVNMAYLHVYSSHDILINSLLTLL